jgi:hypothetical protein
MSEKTERAQPLVAQKANLFACVFRHLRSTPKEISWTQKR